MKRRLAVSESHSQLPRSTEELKIDPAVDSLVAKFVGQNVQLAQAAVDYEQMLSAFYHLPEVPKELQVGHNGGLYYINALGNKVYLKQKQYAQLYRGKLKGCLGQRCHPLRSRKRLQDSQDSYDSQGSQDSRDSQGFQSAKRIRIDSRESQKPRETS